MRIAIAGASGRMGQMLIEAVRAADARALAGALDRADSPALGQDAGAFAGGASGVPVTADLDAGLRGARVLIDFTRPEATLAHLAACRRLGVAMVIGTTGFSDAQKAAIAEARSVASSRLAEREILFRDALKKVYDPVEREKAEEEYRVDRSRIEADRDRAIERIRSGKS